MSDPASFLVIGLGNDFRNDDGCGPLVTRLIDQKRCPGVRLIRPHADDADMIMEWDGAEAAFVVDCVRSGAAPGKIFRFEPLVTAISETVFRPTSSHRLGMTKIIALAQTLGRLPRCLIVFGIEGADVGHGTELSQSVVQAAEEVAEQIVAEIDKLRTGQTHDR